MDERIHIIGPAWIGGYIGLGGLHLDWNDGYQGWLHALRRGVHLMRLNIEKYLRWGTSTNTFRFWYEWLVKNF